MRGTDFLNANEFEKTTKQIPGTARTKPKPRRGIPLINQPDPQTMQPKPIASM
jgi:hypothetical protein